MNKTLQPFASFFVLRSLSASACEIHLVDGAGHDTTHNAAVMHELTAFVRSSFEVLGAVNVTYTQLGEGARWRGIRVAVDDALLDVLARQTIPYLHDTLAGWMKHLYPGIDVVWRPR